MLTNEDKDRLRTLILKVVEIDTVWLETYGVICSFKTNPDSNDGYVLLNYSSFADKNEYNRLVRGMVIRKIDDENIDEPLDLIVSFPFTRFFNFGEVNAATVDLANADMLEKMDGTMVGVFFPNGKPANPAFHTRKMLSVHKKDQDFNMVNFYGQEVNLLSEIDKYVVLPKWTSNDVRYTFIFEFVHLSSMVWTKYTPKDYGLYLIGCRNLDTYEEMNENELDAKAKEIGVMRPRRWDSLNDMAYITSVMKDACSTTSGFEGFVFRDHLTGNRVKMKDEDYVRCHHLLDDLSYRNLVVKILEGETDEILSYFPHAKERIDKIQDTLDQYVENAVQKILNYRSLGLDRKVLADKIFGAKSKRWDKNSGGPVPAVVSAESDAWVATAIMRNAYTNLNAEDLRKLLKEELRKIGLGHESKLTPEQLHSLTQETAYSYWTKGGLQTGKDMQYWLMAEKDVSKRKNASPRRFLEQIGIKEDEEGDM